MAERRVQDIDRGWKRIKRAILKTAPDMVVVVGIQGDDAGEENGDSGFTNAQLGVIHEFGAPKAGIPERAFLRGTVDRVQKQINKQLANAGAQLSIGNGPRKTLELLGVFVVGEIRKTFDRSIGLAPLKAATIARKGSSKPLIDEGQLKGSITSTVVS